METVYSRQYLNIMYIGLGVPGWLVEHAILDLRVLSLSPMLGVEPIEKKTKNKKQIYVKHRNCKF